MIINANTHLIWRKEMVPFMRIKTNGKKRRETGNPNFSHKSYKDNSWAGSLLAKTLALSLLEVNGEKERAKFRESMEQMHDWKAIVANVWLYRIRGI